MLKQVPIFAHPAVERGPSPALQGAWIVKEMDPGLRRDERGFVALKRAVILFFSFILAGCLGEPEIETSSINKFERSIDRVRQELTYDQKILFDEAAQRLVLNHMTNNKLTYLSFDADDLSFSNGSNELDYFSEIFEGMTAPQIISADQVLSDNRKEQYIQLNMYSDLIASFDDNKEKFPMDTVVEWRGKKMRLGDMRRVAYEMDEQAKLTLLALKLKR